MDSLDDFEKTLAADRAEREAEEKKREEKRERKHRHHHHHRSDRRPGRDRGSERDRERDRERHPRPRDDQDGDHGHRHKRSRHRHSHRSRDGGGDDDDDGDDDDRDTKDRKAADARAERPLPDKERTPGDETRPATPLVRDAWMTAPSALHVDYVQRGAREARKKAAAEEPRQTLHKRELNRRLGQEEEEEGGSGKEEKSITKTRVISYTIGDQGSPWRMTKLKGVYRLAETTGRSIDEVARERFGSLAEFDDAREERNELDRRKVYGEGFVGKEKPTGELYQERLAKPPKATPRHEPRSKQEPEQGLVVVDGSMHPTPVLDRTGLNKMMARLMKAQLRKAPDVEKLQADYDGALAALEASESAAPPADAPVVLDGSHNRMLAGPRGEVKPVETTRGRGRGLVEANDDMSIDDMVREERRTRGQAGGEGRRFAERIAQDARFDDELEYLDENAARLAARVHPSDATLKNVAVAEYQKMARALDACPLCHREDRAPPHDLPAAPVLARGTRVFLTLAPAPELPGAEGGAVVVPVAHHANLLGCDDDEWEELRNFMKALTRLYHDQGRDVLFYEDAAAPRRRRHAALVAVPVPYDQGALAPAFFREAMLAAGDEWAQHPKVIDTGRRARDDGLGRMAFRRSLAREMPYFHVWFSLDGGLGHVVEDTARWPRGDLFAREVIGGMLGCEPDLVKRLARWTRDDPRTDDFRTRWSKFDWTRVLTEGGSY
ncbi:hypothetical protein P8C59_000841 [Phyllachora maydis]|uniref:Uncharacterized protein n=1 Tax=Phyllachora maydis TaxID=1825666 RepID=A0AAD9HX78_9PEZI|nr:hypothetical protein P8C59_000841 [Phyllachora maydis]